MSKTGENGFSLGDMSPTSLIEALYKLKQSEKQLQEEVVSLRSQLEEAGIEPVSLSDAMPEGREENQEGAVRSELDGLGFLFDQSGVSFLELELEPSQKEDKGSEVERSPEGSLSGGPANPTTTIFIESDDDQDDNEYMSISLVEDELSISPSIPAEFASQLSASGMTVAGSASKLEDDRAHETPSGLRELGMRELSLPKVVFDGHSTEAVSDEGEGSAYPAEALAAANLGRRGATGSSAASGPGSGVNGLIEDFSTGELFDIEGFLDNLE